MILAVNYAVGALGYDHIVMLGLSGGGWTTTLAAAVDARIALSMPVAGSVPKFATTLSSRVLQPPHWVPDLPEGEGRGEGGGGDYEQSMARPMCVRVKIMSCCGSFACADVCVHACAGSLSRLAAAAASQLALSLHLPATPLHAPRPPPRPPPR